MQPVWAVCIDREGFACSQVCCVGSFWGLVNICVHLDDLGASIGDYPRHLHAVPACPLAHDIAIEAVQNALVS